MGVIDTINKELTIELKMNKKYENFVNWCLDNGLWYKSIDFPIAFGKAGILGVIATENITAKEVSS